LVFGAIFLGEELYETGVVLLGWLPEFQAPDGALLLQQLAQRHRVEAR
jgi:hypothetical protein